MLVVLVALLVLAVYYYGTRNFDYWAKRNVKHDSPVFLFGTNLKGFLGRQSFAQVAVDLYNRYPTEKVVGYYRGTTPELYIRDPDIVKEILTTDFLYFYKRGLGRNTNVEPLLANVFHADGDIWKLTRQRLTPAFTTARLKAMFPLVVQCAEKLQVVAKTAAERDGSCDVRDLMARFTTEFIGACGFGVETNSLNDEDSLFRQIGKLIFARPIGVMIRTMIWELFPVMRSFLHVSNPKIEQTITALVKNIRKERDYKPSKRNDFIDLLLELETKGTIKGDSMERKNTDGTSIPVEMEMDIKMMAAQVFVFFGAGFETSSSATSFTLHELAFNPDIQSKIQAEIDEVLQKYDKKLCYDAVAEMTLLSMAFKESMRIFPSLGVLHRECVRKYTIPGLDITIDPGVKVVIPVQALQMDEKYFENPREFRPERFSPEEVKKQHKFVYMPFGEGPRTCIGSRLGEMQSLAGLAAILQQFSVSPAPETKRIPPVDPRATIVQSVLEGIPLKLTLRNKF